MNCLKKIYVLSLGIFLSMNLIGCSSNVSDATEDDSQDYSTIEVELKGAENLDEDQAVTFGYVKENIRYGVGIIEEEDNVREIGLPVGHYYAFTKEMGRYWFDIKEANQTYTMTVDYDNSQITFDEKTN